MKRYLKDLPNPTDKLTGSYNRRKFKEIIGIEIERVKRYNQPLSIIMFDIDHFKKVNDRYGHSAGDYVLNTIATIVRENIRKIDYFVRWGGEEFLIISSETNLEKASFDATPAAMGSGRAARSFPPGFDTAAFAREAKLNFIRLQAAFDAGNLDDLRAFTSPEIFA